MNAFGLTRSTGEEASPASDWWGCLAWLLFVGAGLAMLLVVSIGMGYGSDDPLLLAYTGVLLLGPVLAWWAVSKRHVMIAALTYVGIVAAALFLGSTFG